MPESDDDDDHQNWLNLVKPSFTVFPRVVRILRYKQPAELEFFRYLPTFTIKIKSFHIGIYIYITYM